MLEFSEIDITQWSAFRKAQVRKFSSIQAGSPKVSRVLKNAVLCYIKLRRIWILNTTYPVKTQPELIKYLIFNAPSVCITKDEQSSSNLLQRRQHK